MFEEVWRCTGRLWSSVLIDGLGASDRASLEMHWEAVILKTQRCTWRSWLSEFSAALRGQEIARWEEYLEAVDGRCTGCWDSIHQIVNSQWWECDKATLPPSFLWTLLVCSWSSRKAHWKWQLYSAVNLKSWDWRDDRQFWVDGAHGACFYAVWAVLSANSCWWRGEIKRVISTLCSAMMVELWTRKGNAG